MVEYIKLRFEDYKKIIEALGDNRNALPKDFFSKIAKYISISDE